MITQILYNMTPLLFASLGVLLTELAGVLNIGMEGIMLWGAFWSMVLLITTQSPWVAIIGAMLAGWSFSLLLTIGIIRWRANIFLAGLSLNLFAWGLTPIMSSLMFQVRGVLNLQQLGIYVPNIQLVLNLFLVLGFVLVIWFGFLLSKTRFGTIFRGYHISPKAIEDLGISIQPYQRIALFLSGILGGIAGALLVLRLGSYVPNISAGRGWISLVVVFLGNKHPWGILLATLVFAFAELVAVEAQQGFGLPGLLIGLPYFLTMLGLIFWAIVYKLKP
jgi:ABC-type uncharacterized transport system permease subunit